VIWFYARLRAVPVGLWAALGAAAAIFVLFLRGRRLEGEIATAKVAVEAARARAEVSRDQGIAATHLQVAAVKGEEVAKLEAVRSMVRKQGDKERRQLSALSPREVGEAYLKMALKKLPDND